MEILTSQRILDLTNRVKEVICEAASKYVFDLNDQDHIIVTFNLPLVKSSFTIGDVKVVIQLVNPPADSSPF
jgi:predicted RNA binding protein with dsRBD fold (UPF0201 family)